MGVKNVCAAYPKDVVLIFLKNWSYHRRKILLYTLRNLVKIKE